MCVYISQFTSTLEFWCFQSIEMKIGSLKTFDDMNQNSIMLEHLQVIYSGVCMQPIDAFKFSYL